MCCTFEHEWLFGEERRRTKVIPHAFGERAHWAVDALGAPHVGERTEKQFVQSAAE